MTSRALRPSAILAASVILALAPRAQAETDLTRIPLEQLLEMRVIAASSYEQPSHEAPSAVSVVTAEDIRRYGYRTLAEALQSLPGLYVTDDLLYAYLGSRGFNRIGDYNSRFQLSVNGLRTNDALYDMAYFDSSFPLDMGLIERIEFAPGPGSSIYGSNAMLGVINIVTRTGGQLPGWRVASALGSDRERELAVSYGRKFENGLDLLASVSGLRSDGPDFYFPDFDTPETHNGIAAGQNGERYRRAYLRASYQGLDFEAFQGRRVKLSPSVAIGGDFLRNEYRVTDALKFATLRYRRDVARDTQAELRVFSGAYDYFGTYPGATGIDNQDDGAGRWNGFEARVVSSAFARHKIVAGAEWQRDTRLYQYNADPGMVYLDRTDQSRRVGIYAQDEYRFAENWLLNIGIRRDNHKSIGSSVNPRFALVGQVAPGTSVKLLYGSAFRAPNAYELYYVENPETGSERLGPERLRSLEAVIEQDRGGELRWRASVFQYRFQDLIEQQSGDVGLHFLNQGSATGRGAEVSVLASLPADFRVRFSASAQDVRSGDDLRLTNSPRYNAKLGIDGPIAGTPLRAAVDVVVIGSRLDRNRDPIATTVVANLVLSTRSPWHRGSFTLGLYNALDRRNYAAANDYFVPAQVPNPGRSLRLTAEWHF